MKLLSCAHPLSHAVRPTYLSIQSVLNRICFRRLFWRLYIMKVVRIKWKKWKVKFYFDNKSKLKVLSRYRNTVVKILSEHYQVRLSAYFNFTSQYVGSDGCMFMCDFSATGLLRQSLFMFLTTHTHTVPHLSWDTSFSQFITCVWSIQTLN